jgi:hypothetical protein
MPMVEDITLFMDVDEFASTGALDHVQVQGIFDNGYTAALDGMSAQVPTFTLPSASCLRTRQGSQLRLPDLGNAGLYTVQAIEPDGTGMTRLVLQKARAA